MIFYIIFDSIFALITSLPVLISEYFEKKNPVKMGVGGCDKVVNVGEFCLINQVMMKHVYPFTFTHLIIGQWGCMSSSYIILMHLNLR